MQLHQRREAEAHAVAVRLGKSRAQDAVKQKAGFKVGTGRRVLDRADAVAQIELLLRSATGPSKRWGRRRRLAVLLTYGSACESCPRSRNTARPAGTAAKISASRSGANSSRSFSTKPF